MEIIICMKGNLSSINTLTSNCNNWVWKFIQSLETYLHVHCLDESVFTVMSDDCYNKVCFSCLHSSTELEWNSVISVKVSCFRVPICWIISSPTTEIFRTEYSVTPTNYIALYGFAGQRRKSQDPWITRGELLLIKMSAFPTRWVCFLTVRRSPLSSLNALYPDVSVRHNLSFGESKYV